MNVYPMLVRIVGQAWVPILVEQGDLLRLLDLVRDHVTLDDVEDGLYAEQ